MRNIYRTTICILALLVGLPVTGIADTFTPEDLRYNVVSVTVDMDIQTCGTRGTAGKYLGYPSQTTPHTIVMITQSKTGVRTETFTID